MFDVLSSVGVDCDLETPAEGPLHSSAQGQYKVKISGNIRNSYLLLIPPFSQMLSSLRF